WVVGAGGGRAGGVVGGGGVSFRPAPKVGGRSVETPPLGPDGPRRCLLGRGRRCRGARRGLGLSARRLLAAGRAERRRHQREQHEWERVTRARELSPESDHDESPSPSIRVTA